MFSSEAYDLLEESFKVLQSKTKYAYPRMVGYLMPNVSLEDAKRVAEIIEKWEGDNK